jgi:hypothetical protein
MMPVSLECNIHHVDYLSELQYVSSNQKHVSALREYINFLFLATCRLHIQS